MYREGVIGLGAIASGYGKPEDAAPYCHVGGVMHSDQVELAAVVDLASAARERFQTVWGASFPQTTMYDDLQTMLECEVLDIVAVCVRGPHHYAVLQQVLASAPRAVFLEKPPTCSLLEMDTVLAQAATVNEIGFAGIESVCTSQRILLPNQQRTRRIFANG